MSEKEKTEAGGEEKTGGRWCKYYANSRCKKEEDDSCEFLHVLPSSWTCSNCNKEGHRVADCPLGYCSFAERGKCKHRKDNGKNCVLPHRKKTEDGEEKKERSSERKKELSSDSDKPKKVKSQQNKVCHYFNTPDGCQYSDDCKMLHLFLFDVRNMSEELLHSLQFAKEKFEKGKTGKKT
jgi:hypothetical protein